MLQALNSSKVAIWNILANKEIVKQYDQGVRALILSDTENAEYIIQKHFEKVNVEMSTYLKASQRRMYTIYWRDT